MKRGKFHQPGLIPTRFRVSPVGGFGAAKTFIDKEQQLATNFFADLVLHVVILEYIVHPVQQRK